MRFVALKPSGCKRTSGLMRNDFWFGVAVVALGMLPVALMGFVLFMK
jgi:hypothetical protein